MNAYEVLSFCEKAHGMTFRLVAAIEDTPAYVDDDAFVAHALLVESKGAMYAAGLEQRRDDVVALPLCDVATDEYQQQWNRLEQMSVPVVPKQSLSIVDGNQVTLLIFGDSSSFTASWWNVPPEGYWGLADFAEWLTGKLWPQGS